MEENKEHVEPEEQEVEVEIGPVRKRVKVVGATYMEEEKALFIIGECDEGDFKHMIDRDALATFGNRTEEEIIEEMHKTAQLMEGKQIWLIYDPEAEKKLDKGEELDYSDLPESKIDKKEESNESDQSDVQNN